MVIVVRADGDGGADDGNRDDVFDGGPCSYWPVAVVWVRSDSRDGDSDLCS